MSPRYSTLHINLGILKGATGDPEMAEQYFRNALEYDPGNPEGYYYYARWLNQVGRPSEALPLLVRGAALSPNHARMASLRMTLETEVPDANANLLERLGQEVEAQPSAESYVNLSRQYYRLERYEDCIEACRQALALAPDSAVAYSNICSAYIKLGKWESAIQACNQALEIAPAFDMAHANLAWAEQSRAEAQAEAAELGR